MKVKLRKPKEVDSPLKSYGEVKSDSGNEYLIIHLKKRLKLRYICTCKGFLFNLKCKHLDAYIKKEKTK